MTKDQKMVDVLMRPEVSRRLCQAPYGHYGKHGKKATTGLDFLVIARVARRTRNRAARNQREEVEAYGVPKDAYDRGMIVHVPRGPEMGLLLRRALGCDDVGSDLAEMIRRALS